MQKEGFFSKKSKTTKQFSRYWFILKNDVLSYYGNQTVRKQAHFFAKKKRRDGYMCSQQHDYGILGIEFLSYQRHFAMPHMSNGFVTMHCICLILG